MAQQHKWTPEQEEKAKELFNLGCTRNQIATELGIKPKAVQHKLVKQGMKRRNYLLIKYGTSEPSYVEQWPEWKPEDNVYAFFTGYELRKQA